MFKKSFIIAAMIALTYAGCSSSSNGGTGSTVLDVSKPSSIMTSVQTAIATASTGMTTATLIEPASADGSIHPSFVVSDCTDHGDPATAAVPGGQSDVSYPGLLTYCKISKNDYSPDTVQGGFELVKSLSCALESSGITWDNAPHAVDLSIAAPCFNATQIANMGGGTMAITVTASTPASFNSYFDRSIVLTIPSFGTFQFATKKTGNKFEFITYENQSATLKGTTYGSLDTSSGDLRFEARSERIDCATNGSCGWNRHIRIYANLTMSTSGTPTDLNSISFAYSNIQDSPGQSGPGGLIVTASGNMTSGIKPRLWQATNGSGGPAATRADVYNIGKWTEVVNAKCYTRASTAAGTCGTGISGLAGNTYFLLPSSGYTTGYTPSSTFITSYPGGSYTSVSLTTDPQ